jgi:hypothetical protein
LSMGLLLAHCEKAGLHIGAFCQGLPFHGGIVLGRVGFLAQLNWNSAEPPAPHDPAVLIGLTLPVDLGNLAVELLSLRPALNNRS